TLLRPSSVREVFAFTSNIVEQTSRRHRGTTFASPPCDLMRITLRSAVLLAPRGARDLVGSPTSACDPLALGTRAINERHEISRSYRVRWLRAIGAALGGVLLLASPGHAGVLNASWTAPTVNTDGSPLTDLGLYRVYYGAGTTDPCRGSSFIS